MKNKSCYIYTRVSTSMQVDGFSLEAQKEKLRKYAEFQEFIIAGEYSDEGKSGKSIEGRLEFQQMLSDISSGKDSVDYVLVFKLSRFGRNAADVLNSLQQMQDYGVNLICVEDGIDSSKDSGELMISVLSAVAEIERENILVQTMEGRKQKAREGKWNGGFAPYGYKLVDGELKVAEDEAEVIRVIYDKFIHTTMGANTVAKYLNQQGFVKKKRQNGTLDTFTAHFVKLVLDNPIYCGKIAYGRRKTEKMKGSRSQSHVVKQDDYMVYDGIHQGIIDEKDWLLAQDKRKKTGIKNEKIYSVEHQHLLSGILRCPECGAGLYGSVNRKRKKDGSFYRDYWYYACKHRMEYDGHKCTYRKQIQQDIINDAVVEVIRHIVKNSRFDKSIKEKLEVSTDLEIYKTEENSINTHIKQLNAAKKRLGIQIDQLDYSDKHYEEKYSDMQNRMNSLYDEIAEAQESLETVQMQIQGIHEQQISQERIFEFLELFDIIYDKFTEIEKKEFLQSFIKRIEIYPQPLENGQILKSIQFRFPIYYRGNEGNTFFPNSENTVETVVLLTRKPF
ncbi:recombinase family protein [Clostridiaceae bacterium DONG20-135]|uniref:Recombinase family protein n=1 Tax=Copranaerobaculum intestinale TaxID=2692629 RepID=A0A6N8U531_9FIRM|nr:recombinase family protein [Copranaerobaculum intestinale]MXQ73060.1 recombinase family protein [Copranaerobaculum intestinale]